MRRHYCGAPTKNPDRPFCRQQVMAGERCSLHGGGGRRRLSNKELIDKLTEARNRCEESQWGTRLILADVITNLKEN